VSNNTASGAGGGINIQAGTVNLLNGTSLEANTATSIGGGVANSGTLNVTGSGTARISFSGNQAVNSSGGGIYNSGITTVNFGNFVENKASDIGTGGGAIFNVGAITTLSVGNSVFSASPLNLPNNIAGLFTNAGGNTPLNP
jgi:predicted outer membrane repeat protein